MSWKAIHCWLGLTLGTLAVVLGITGAILAIDPVQQAWQAPAAPGNLPVATLVERVARSVPHAEEIRRLPSGAIVVFSFAGDQPQASYVDPADGQVLGAWQASALPRWVKNLHRSLLLGDAGRWGAAGIALTMGLLCVSALVLLLRRMGGWRRLAARVRGSLAQRIHVVTGRVVLAVLCLTSLTALTMSASTLGLVALDTRAEPEVISLATGKPDTPAAQLTTLQNLRVQDLRKLTFPGATDPEDTWKVATAQGQGWIDRRHRARLRQPGHGAGRGRGARRSVGTAGLERIGAESQGALCRRCLLNSMSTLRPASAPPCTARPWARAGLSASMPTPLWTSRPCARTSPLRWSRWTRRCRPGSQTATSCA